MTPQATLQISWDATIWGWLFSHAEWIMVSIVFLNVFWKDGTRMSCLNWEVQLDPKFALKVERRSFQCKRWGRFWIWLRKWGGKYGRRFRYHFTFERFMFDTLIWIQGTLALETAGLTYFLLAIHMNFSRYFRPQTLYSQASARIVCIITAIKASYLNINIKQGGKLFGYLSLRRKTVFNAMSTNQFQ